MNEDEARALLVKLMHRIAPEVDIDDVDPRAPLQEEVDLDSMDFLHLVTALHEATGIDVPERDYPAISSVAGFIAYVVASPAA